MIYRYVCMCGTYCTAGGVSDLRSTQSTAMGAAAMTSMCNEGEHSAFIRSQGHSEQMDKTVYQRLPQSFQVRRAAEGMIIVLLCLMYRVGVYSVIIDALICVCSVIAYERVAVATSESLATSGEPFASWGKKAALPSASEQVEHVRRLQKRKLCPEDYGAEHPQRDTVGGAGSVVRWTDNEKAFVEEKLQEFLALPIEKQRGGKWAYCLTQIEESSCDVKALFHPWHVTDSTKIRSAIRTKC